MAKSKKKTNYKAVNKHYDVMGVGESDYTAFKIVTGKNARKVDGKEKASYYICKIVDDFSSKPLHKEPLTNYKAYMQFQELVLNNPQALKKGTYKLNADGTLSKALITALGTDKIAKVDGVSTLAKLDAEMKEW